MCVRSAHQQPTSPRHGSRPESETESRAVRMRQHARMTVSYQPSATWLSQAVKAIRSEGVAPCTRSSTTAEKNLLPLKALFCGWKKTKDLHHRESSRFVELMKNKRTVQFFRFFPFKNLAVSQGTVKPCRTNWCERYSTARLGYRAWYDLSLTCLECLLTCT